MASRGPRGSRTRHLPNPRNSGLVHTSRQGQPLGLAREGRPSSQVGSPRARTSHARREAPGRSAAWIPRVARRLPKRVPVPRFPPRHCRSGVPEPTIPPRPLGPGSGDVGGDRVQDQPHCFWPPAPVAFGPLPAFSRLPEARDLRLRKRIFDTPGVLVRGGQMSEIVAPKFPPAVRSGGSQGVGSKP